MPSRKQTSVARLHDWLVKCQDRTADRQNDFIHLFQLIDPPHQEDLPEKWNEINTMIGSYL